MDGQNVLTTEVNLESVATIFKQILKWQQKSERRVCLNI